MGFLGSGGKRRLRLSLGRRKTLQGRYFPVDEERTGHRVSHLGPGYEVGDERPFDGCYGTGEGRWGKVRR